MVDVEKIKEARKAARLTQRELASIIHLSQGYIGDIERGRTNPSIETLQLIADALHMDIAEFVGNSTTVQKTGMTNDEIHWLMIYRSLNDSDKELARAMLQRFVVPVKSARYSNSPPPIMMKKVRSAQG